jgi:uncharacterized membrane protein
MTSPGASRSSSVFANLINLILALTQIGILVVLALIFKELRKIITGDNYINVNTYMNGEYSTDPLWIRVVE